MKNRPISFVTRKKIKRRYSPRRSFWVNKKTELPQKPFKYNPKKEAETRFKERFKDYLKGKEEYLDYVRDRWTNEEVVYIFQYGLRLGKRRKK